jgi:hypothetical protein
MEYVKRIRCLENYVIRHIPSDLYYVDQEGKKQVDITNPRYYYGRIPQNLIDSEGNLILDSVGQPIPNTINIDIFLTQKFDDIGIFNDTFLNELKSSNETINDEEDKYCPTLLDMSLDENNVSFISSQGVPLPVECCNFEVVQIPGVFWDGMYCRINTDNNNSSKCPTAYQVMNSANKGIYIIPANNQPMTSQCCTTKITNQSNVYWDGEYCRINNNSGSVGDTKPLGINNNNTVR